MLISLCPAYGTAPAFFEAISVDDVMGYLKGLPEDSTVFIDIDDTIITPCSTAFRASSPDKSMIDQIKEKRELYPNFEDILSHWRLSRKTMLIDKKWPDALKDLSSRGIKAFGLTQMGTGKFGSIPSMEQWRYNELRSLGIVFSELPDSPQAKVTGASLYKGIYFTGDKNSKSETLAQFIPLVAGSTLIIIDDREKHLADLQKFCAEHGIKFVGILFKGLEMVPGQPNPAVSKFQKEYLIEHAKWLEDDEVKELMQRAERKVVSGL